MAKRNEFWVVEKLHPFDKQWESLLGARTKSGAKRLAKEVRAAGWVARIVLYERIERI